MATNNPAQDRYDPPPITHTDFDTSKFSEIENDELFWLNNQGTDNNHAFRKINDNQGLNTITRQTHNISNRTKIYQKI